MMLETCAVKQMGVLVRGLITLHIAAEAKGCVLVMDQVL